MTATIFSDLACELGEGPAAHPALRAMFWFDIIGRRLLERGFDGGATLVHELPFMASMMAVIDDERQLILAEDGLYVREVRSGALSLCLPVEADNETTRSNDARVHPCGAFWFGTMGKRGETGAGSVYWFFKGELRRLYDGITVINSICFSPDGRIAYFADTRIGTIWRVETDPLTGLPIGERQVFIVFPPGEGGPDGSVTDAAGFIWNARWGGGHLDAYDPANGRRVRSLPIPARQCSCPAFLDPAAGGMVVTSAYERMSAAERAADPLAGQTFELRLDVTGRFDPPVAMG